MNSCYVLCFIGDNLDVLMVHRKQKKKHWESAKKVKDAQVKRGLEVKTKPGRHMIHDSGEHLQCFYSSVLWNLQSC